MYEYGDSNSKEGVPLTELNIQNIIHLDYTN